MFALLFCTSGSFLVTTVRSWAKVVYGVERSGIPDTIFYGGSRIPWLLELVE
jgi:hypothetical protein